MTCSHYWVLTPFLARDAPGECKKCGATKTFKGDIEYEGNPKSWRDRRRPIVSEHKPTPQEKAADEVLRAWGHTSYYEAV
jgi:hypothetical protein